MDCSPPGSSVHGILLARILEWVAIPFSKWSSQPGDQTWVSCIAGRFFTIWTTREAHQDRIKGTGLFGNIFKIFSLGLWLISEQICWSFSGLPVATVQESQSPASEHITHWVLCPKIWRERDVYGLWGLADPTLARALQFVILRVSHVTLKIQKQFPLKITILALGPPISKPLKGPFVVCNSSGMCEFPITSTQDTLWVRALLIGLVVLHQCCMVESAMQIWFNRKYWGLFVHFCIRLSLSWFRTVVLKVWFPEAASPRELVKNANNASALPPELLN